MRRNPWPETNYWVLRSKDEIDPSYEEEGETHGRPHYYVSYDLGWAGFGTAKAFTRDEVDDLDTLLLSGWYGPLVWERVHEKFVSEMEWENDDWEEGEPAVWTGLVVDIGD